MGAAIKGAKECSRGCTWWQPSCCIFHLLPFNTPLNLDSQEKNLARNKTKQSGQKNAQMALSLPPPESCCAKPKGVSTRRPPPEGRGALCWSPSGSSLFLMLHCMSSVHPLGSKPSAQHALFQTLELNSLHMPRQVQGHLIRIANHFYTWPHKAQNRKKKKKTRSPLEAPQCPEI